MTNTRFDVAVVGAGMAGISLAALLAPERSVVVLEREAHPAMHATGRSAAFYAETYGGPGVQPLTTASRDLLFSPPPEFSEQPLVSDRGALHVARQGKEAFLDALSTDFDGTGVRIETLTAAETEAKAPLLRADWRRQSLWEPGCRDIDVAGLHAAYLRQARRAGAQILTEAELESASFLENWQIETRRGRVQADLLVNAGGAWADHVAAACGVSPIGLQPLRRTMVVADLDRPVADDWPLTVDAEGGFYYKPDAGRLWISPHDEVPAPAGDAQPEEIDIAVAVDRFESAADAHVARIERSWAGLRTFAPDRLPVYGFEAADNPFFWCAGQGGFGIQTAPAAADLCAALILGRPVPHGLNAGTYAARRFR
ncbi:NAD(P)/FAD-dependent oxidoreductase [Pacificimonas flava]|uniref:NAD(P)/FAD-dependent oxidoreductase n=1 Tax=Pacificimonas flava TaxID=1234595 RepID=UPI001CCC61F7|nr:FAD-dependent oxidoreductase [Pacificimonas flava]